MAKKEDLFSKLNIKDYNNQLEKVLEKKPFSESVKNILLNILYKIETSYEDYSKVKINVNSKKEILEETIKTIKEKCDKIDFIRPQINEQNVFQNKKYIIDKNRIISYPNEKNVFYALNNLNKDQYKIKDTYSFLQKPLEELLNQGYISEIEEIIRDFDRMGMEYFL